ncbi:prolyl oligopeptidase family serine peptidase [Nonomuraea sp. MCN248]|uniref:Prolyl oligopeptidase family serine peptidase n=1 Tax=Nonomuraea corallina TaxID=2989783 RepID=A0ABT4SFD5_9ACTN|nr:prolyl oligopeptidase family serine peptidase [Nonomuraea corallina]MDA0635917.1 prolyl oligopeptidase family serine peptidase [Nonomuraea corallina]
MPAALWLSPISTSDVARAAARPGWPVASGGAAWWTEDRPEEGGRTTIVRLAADGSRTELLPPPWNARTRVHEYGGRPYAVTPDGGVVFTQLTDQRLYACDPSGEIRPLTPEGDRYADLAVRDDRVWCVRERHPGGGKVSRAIVTVPLAGGDAAEQVAGHDFYASPTLSPDGLLLAYVCWNHPRMPWHGTELRVTRLSDGETWTVAGGHAESVLAPRWRDDGCLYLISDRSGWWNLYTADPRGGAPKPLCPREEEFAWPPWHLGGLPYAILGDGRLAVLHGRGDLRLGVLDPRTGILTDLPDPYTGWEPTLAADGTSIIGIGYGPTTPASVTRVDTTATEPPGTDDPAGRSVPGETTGAAGAWSGGGGVEALSGDDDRVPDPAYLPTPRPVTLPGDGDREVHAFLYPPAHPDHAVDGPRPYVIFVHGGPTWHATTALDLTKAFLTSRGIGVLDVNYAGSTGYGRAYRELLKGRWGLIDVADVVAAARWLAAEGHADPGRIAVRGGSAGGWTVMAACCRSGAFAGGVSYYGVSALAPLNAHTHDFESRYVEWLVGPEDPRLYAEREPLALAGGVSCPMLLLQGLDDPVVPSEQSAAFAEALAERGIPCTYLAFDGEAHGFRRAETRSTALAAEFAFYQQVFL